MVDYIFNVFSISSVLAFKDMILLLKTQHICFDNMLFNFGYAYEFRFLNQTEWN